MSKTKKIEMSGGFHGCKPIRFKVWAADLINANSPEDFLTGGQMRRAQRHFCGLASCCCGGVYRASWEVV